MTFEEYDQQQRQITAALAAVLLVILAPITLAALTTAGWISLLHALFPHIEGGRRESAELARRFFDAERAHHTGLPERHPVLLAGYQWDWFAEAMSILPAELRDYPRHEDQIARVISVALKEVENGGRSTLLRATRSDRPAGGWARVATGEQTCAFCLTMVSRGPAYFFASDAGLDTDDTEAMDLYDQLVSARTAQEKADADEVLAELMTQWHPNCDCRVVPVYNANWPGREAHEAAEDLYGHAVRTHKGQDAINAVRRVLYEQNKDAINAQRRATYARRTASAA
ncbi:hypothetical protein D5S17_09375 [Pseudonocardiaceae bacterium YIM PH 21723]|nr:hypothetical protein D5S17_09375 [Pseudonocardiaceae bacterium YIM PH 21723]